MDAQCKSAFKEAILKILPVVAEQAARVSEPYLVWSKRGDGQWSGHYQERPNLRHVYVMTNKQLEEASTSFSRLFFAKHPEYEGMVGFPRFSTLLRLGHDKSGILRSVIWSLWTRHGTFDCEESWVDAIVEEFEEFVDRPTARFRFQAQLLNYSMSAARLELPENLSVRRLTEDEVSTLHGGPLQMLGLTGSPTTGIHEFVIEGEQEEAKAFGHLPAGAGTAPDEIKTLLDRAVICFRTLKTGPIGYNYVRFEPVKFCPLPLYSHSYGNAYVPFGSYHLADEEIGGLREYATLFFATSEPAMDMACSRLADAEIRTRPEDRIVDAVIGMETLLLGALGSDDRRGELRFRFSLHYALLFDSPDEQYRRFRTAKDLYDLRSKIAHGGSFKNVEFRLGNERLKLADAGSRATEALRGVIRHFLPQAKAAPYKKPEFWDRAYFGITDVE